MKKIFFARLLTWLLICNILSFSCTSSKSNTIEEKISSEEEVFEIQEEVILEAKAEPLTAHEYLQWVKEQTGLTYSERENAQFKISILYRPLNLEAALCEGVVSEKQYIKNKELKKNYHYLSVEFLEKYISAREEAGSRREALKRLKDNLMIVVNQSDTIQNFIVEEFPSVMMNQPGQLLILVPREKKPVDFEAIISGQDHGMKDLKLTIKAQQFELFPELKL